MKINKGLLTLIFLVLSELSLAQDFSNLWGGHFSYNSIVDVVTGNNMIFAAAENAVFSYDPLTSDITKITTIDGLSGRDITTIYFSDNFQSLLIGYNTGLIELYSISDRTVLSIVDILDKDNITPDKKQINHFYEHEGLVYISTNFGISVYDLERLEFGDTYFIGNGGSQIRVNQTSVLNNKVYAACLDGIGLIRGDLSNPNLIDFSQWETVLPGNFRTVNTFNNKIYATRLSRFLFEIDDNENVQLFQFDNLPVDSKVQGENIVFTSNTEVLVYDTSINLINFFQPSSEFSSNLTASVNLNNSIYIGTNEFGIITSALSDGVDYLQILPNGPSENNMFRLNATTGTVWATYGAYTEALNPYPLASKGISYLFEEEWTNIKFDSLFGARELNEITPNVFNSNQVYISSFFNGILELNDFEPTILLDQTNSGLESLVLPNNPDYVDIRVSAAEFDSNGLLWNITSFVERPLKSYDPISGSWQSYNFSALIENPSDENGFFDMEIDRNGTKWIGAYNNGLIAFNENIANDPLRKINSESQNVLPFTRFTALALDNRNQLWCGTTKGLRVLFNTAGFYEDPNPTMRSIIILEDGIPKELLANQGITDIKVDGSNNKWVGTADSGVFYFSPDGQNTIYHFTVDNSPLPSNTINDMSIDADNGIVYFATTRGLVSFRSGGSATKETLDDAYVYPNPVRPEYEVLGFDDLNDINKGIKITGLTERVNIKITDVEGNLVAEAQSNVNLRSSSANYNFAIDGGTAIWNGKNLSNSIVRTGVYLIMISDLDSFETKVLKVLIVR
ncbi:ABC transporter substrate-binding protein [Winogradskyella poriferorum]|uniref:type IX secretion system anionic LPS delivery protein PorZ n=1 Tax=Winogradskyella poriferorum TaxID=307627 RepID=UPI003D65EB93